MYFCILSPTTLAKISGVNLHPNSYSLSLANLTILRNIKFISSSLPVICKYKLSLTFLTVDITSSCKGSLLYFLDTQTTCSSDDTVTIGFELFTADNAYSICLISPLASKI
ncbi:hypothetical protein A0H76_1472 [Hepatospora eriocheir]|uniref:Uncharacterized protein n=1 Tax=Hepatospora eriocheir TaxID=1081669 RepID=A0A1X0QGZ9_9MICR|nr:hypothetical protein A0H76_1472 [Hepatospora eriocheir]